MAVELGSPAGGREDGVKRPVPDGYDIHRRFAPAAGVDLPTEVYTLMTKQENIRNFSIIARIDLVVARSVSLASA